MFSIATKKSGEIRLRVGKYIALDRSYVADTKFHFFSFRNGGSTFYLPEHINCAERDLWTKHVILCKLKHVAF